MPAITNLSDFQNKLLTNFSTGYRPNKYVNREALPPVEVDDDSGSYITELNDNMLVDDARAIRARAKSVDFNFAKGTFSLEEHALSLPLDKKKEIEKAVEISSLKLNNLKESSVRKLLNMLEVRREYLAAQMLHGTGNYHSNNKKALSGNSCWSDYTNSDPVGDIMTGIDMVRNTIGYNPNGLVMDSYTWALLRNHPAILAYYKVNQGMASKEQVMALFDGIDTIVVGTAMYNAGTPSVPSPTNFWADNCAIIPIPSAQELADGAQVHSVMFDQLSAYGSYEFDEGEVVRMMQTVAYGVMKVNDKAGYLISNTKA